MPEFGELGEEFGRWLPFDHLYMRAMAKGDLPHASELVRNIRYGLGLEVKDCVHGQNGGKIIADFPF
jgi:hypothetical protein